MSVVQLIAQKLCEYREKMRAFRAKDKHKAFDRYSWYMYISITIYLSMDMDAS